MSLRVGIGIITYNRRDILAQTVDRVRRLTRYDAVDLVVADDGSSDGTLEMLRSQNVPVVTGVNMGIAWNKNRALFLLAQMLGCEVVLLLEDDTHPICNGWEAEWIEAANRWGHVNWAGPGMRAQFLSGSGTAADPIRSRSVTAQCASYTRKALTYGGYFDSRFKGYGHEHVEHTRRMIRVGYGGTEEFLDGQQRIIFKVIHGNVHTVDTPSFSNPDEVARNLQVARELMSDQAYRAPWRNDVEMKQFRSEMDSALEGREGGFALRGGPAPTRAAPTWTAPAQTAPARSLRERLRRLFRA